MSSLALSRRLLPVVLLAVVLILGACGEDDSATTSGDGDEAPAAGDVVVIERFTFMPQDIEVAAGATVTWTNQDSASHTIEDTGELFPESEDLAEGDEFSFTYDAPGEYPYICGIHGYMTGTVTVT